MSQAKAELKWALIGGSDIAKTRMIDAINPQPNSRITRPLLAANGGRAKA
jgi:hypothetical protein